MVISLHVIIRKHDHLGGKYLNNWIEIFSGIITGPKWFAQ